MLRRVKDALRRFASLTRLALRRRSDGVGTKGVPLLFSTACGASNKGLNGCAPLLGLALLVSTIPYGRFGALFP